MLLLIAVLGFISTGQVSAQQNGGDAAMMQQRMRERIKPQLMEKAQLSSEQADKVVDINFQSRQQLRELRNENLSDADRKTKMAELQATLSKKYKEIPLSDEQVAAVNKYYEEMRNNTQRRNN